MEISLIAMLEMNRFVTERIDFDLITIHRTIELPTIAQNDTNRYKIVRRATNSGVIS